MLQTEEDFYDLTWPYLARIHRDHALHTEIFFDPQAHTGGVPFARVIEGIHQALLDGRRELGISSKLILLCFLRHLEEDDAQETLDQALPFRDRIVAVGTPPNKGYGLLPEVSREATIATVIELRCDGIKTEQAPILPLGADRAEVAVSRATGEMMRKPNGRSRVNP